MANTVKEYADGVGNKVNAIQWDNDPDTLTNITNWTKRVHVNKRGVLGVQTKVIVQHVGVGDWLVMDSRRVDQVFPMTNPQFVATYIEHTPA